MIEVGVCQPEFLEFHGSQIKEHQNFWRWNENRVAFLGVKEREMDFPNTMTCDNLRMDFLSTKRKNWQFSEVALESRREGG